MQYSSLLFFSLSLQRFKPLENQRGIIFDSNFTIYEIICKCYLHYNKCAQQICCKFKSASFGIRFAIQFYKKFRYKVSNQKERAITRAHESFVRALLLGFFWREIHFAYRRRFYLEMRAPNAKMQKKMRASLAVALRQRILYLEWGGLAPPLATAVMSAYADMRRGIHPHPRYETHLLYSSHSDFVRVALGASACCRGTDSKRGPKCKMHRFAGYSQQTG